MNSTRSATSATIRYQTSSIPWHPPPPLWHKKVGTSDSSSTWWSSTDIVFLQWSVTWTTLANTGHQASGTPWELSPLYDTRTWVLLLVLVPFSVLVREKYFKGYLNYFSKYWIPGLWHPSRALPPLWHKNMNTFTGTSTGWSSTGIVFLQWYLKYCTGTGKILEAVLELL